GNGEGVVLDVAQQRGRLPHGHLDVFRRRRLLVVEGPPGVLPAHVDRRPSTAASAREMASRASSRSAVFPDRNTRPLAPIICTSLSTTPGAARSASLAATQANRTGIIS